MKLINHFNARSLRGFMTPEVCTHWHPRTLLFYNLELIIYAAASGNYSHPQKLFTSNSQLQLSSEALSFFAYKPRFVSLSCFSLASLFFFISQIDSNSARCINFLLSASDSTYPYDQGAEECGKRRGSSLWCRCCFYCLPRTRGTGQAGKAHFKLGCC